MRKPNRPNKCKRKKGAGCAMCKPHKHAKVRAMRKDKFLKLVAKVVEENRETLERLGSE